MAYEHIKEIWENWKPYRVTPNSRSYIVMGHKATELGIEEGCLHICKSGDELYAESAACFIKW